MNNDICSKPKHMTNIGGQALIEGLMMIGPKESAIAVRKPDGEIVVEKKPLPKKSKLSKIPVVRGAVGLVRQLVLGIKALMYSAEFVDVEDAQSEPSKIDRFIEKVFGDKFQDAAIYFAVIVSLAMSIGLFILLPHVLASFIPFDKSAGWAVVAYNLFEGLIRISLFVGYLFLASNLKDIRRVWQYHGAEHKTIHCYEHQEELTVENVRRHTTRHPRCGTSFMFLVMIISIIIFSMVGWKTMWIRLLSRLILIPLIAGISYEILKLAGKSQGIIMRIVSAPGLAIQGLTTSEPDDQQIEVAIEAMKSVLGENKEEDKW